MLVATGVENEGMRGETSRSIGALVVAVACLTLAGCAVNPATGKRQIMLISEAQEIEIGRQNDEAIVAQFGLYENEELQRYVSQVGRELAAQSERPDLDWTFRVLDDTLINAFALPGGYVYLTRGILAHFNNEAEMASVLGHEIGHVTARHGANQMSKSQLAQLGLAVGSIATPERFGGLVDLAGAGMQLAFLKFSRDDERQADDLGLRYVVRGGFDPRPMGDVFVTLKRVSEAQSQGGLPGWLSTHPDPGNREGRIADQIAAMGRDFSGSRLERAAYQQRIDGIVFGDDPRQGYFIGTAFYHPEMAFRLDFPEGWKTVNARSFVAAQSAEQDAVIRLSLSDEEDADSALQEFLAQESIRPGESWNRSVNGIRAAGSRFSAVQGEGSAPGEIAFFEHRDLVFQIIGLSRGNAWDSRGPGIRNTLESFRTLTDRRYLDVEPRRLGIVRLDRSMTVAEFAGRYGATIPEPELAILNGLEPGARLRSGETYKVVRGGKLPEDP